MRLLLLLLFSASASAADRVTLLRDRTFPRDTSFCKIKGKLLKVSLRSPNRTFEQPDAGHGEIAFYEVDDKVFQFPIGSSGVGRYRFLSIKDSLCTNSLGGLLLDGGSVALLFLRSNRPFKGKLVIQHFDPKTMRAGAVDETEHLAEAVVPYSGGFAFRSRSEPTDIDTGTVTIAKHEYTYHDRPLPYWVSYSSKGARTRPELSFEKFPWKDLFENKAEFLKTAGWNEKQGKFANDVLYLAFNHELKKECVLLTDARKSLSGAEGWRCRARTTTED